MTLEQMLKEISDLDPYWHFLFTGIEWRAKYTNQTFYFSRQTLEDIVRAVYLSLVYPTKYEVSQFATYVESGVVEDEDHIVYISFPTQSIKKSFDIIKEKGLPIV